jgi:hypothetical protein
MAGGEPACGGFEYFEVDAVHVALCNILHKMVMQDGPSYKKWRGSVGGEG